MENVKNITIRTDEQTSVTVTAYAEAISAGDYSELTADDLVNADFYKKLAYVYCDNNGVDWVNAKRTLRIIARKFGEDVYNDVKENLEATQKIEFSRAKKRKASDAAKENAVGTASTNAVAREVDASSNALELTDGQQQVTFQHHSNDELGCYKIDPYNGRIRICNTPMIVTKKYVNDETGRVQYHLRYIVRENGTPVIREKIVPADILLNKSSLLKLSADGLLINSSNASDVVEYLTDNISSYELAGMPQGLSTTKFGWTRNGILSPFDDSVVFDGEDQYRQLYDAFTDVAGDRDIYLNKMRWIRSLGRLEYNVFISAALASLLVSVIHINSFVVHVYGKTECGKTLAMLVALSQLGQSEVHHGMITTYKNKPAGLEFRLHCLNHLPAALDDCSQLTRDMERNIEGFIYDLCEGIGSLRGTKEGGNRVLPTWQNLTMSTGETTLSSYCRKAGGTNRVIEIRAEQSAVFEHPEDIAAFFADNHGHVIRPFAELISTMGRETIAEIYDKYKHLILPKKGTDVLSKQVQPLAVILTADELLTDYIYYDDVYLRDRLDDLVAMLKGRSDIDEHQQAYDYLADVCTGNDARFQWDTAPEDRSSNAEQWGWTRDEYMYVFPSFLKSILNRGGYRNIKEFTRWAIEHQLTDANKDGTCKNYTICGASKRAWRFRFAESAPVPTSTLKPVTKSGRGSDPNEDAYYQQLAQYMNDAACHTRDAQRTPGQQAVRDVAHDAG